MNMNMKTKKDYELLSIVLGLKISTDLKLNIITKKMCSNRTHFLVTDKKFSFFCLFSSNTKPF